MQLETDLKQKIADIEKQLGAVNLTERLSTRVSEIEQQLGIVCGGMNQSLAQRLDEIKKAVGGNGKTV